MRRSGITVSTRPSDVVVMKTPMLNPLRGTGMEGGWIWVIIVGDGSVNSLMGFFLIYQTKVAKASVYD